MAAVSQSTALIALAALLLGLLAAAPVAAQELPFAIHVVDSATGAPAPCVTLRTVDKLRLRSDDNGVIAFFEPGLLGRDVWFQTTGPPWELPGDWLGFPGVTLSTEPGGSATVSVDQSASPPPCAAGDGHSQLISDGLPPLEQRHGLRVFDAETGRGLPLVELRSGASTWVTDSAGLVAFLEPDWLGGSHAFEVFSHGFEPRSAVDLTLTPGGRSQLALERAMPAERLYRVTGAGIYRDSVLLGEPVPLAEPLLNAQVAGIDSVHTAVHEGRVFWIWGDTLRPSYVLGHFKTAAATSLLPADGGLDPSQGVDLQFFVNEDGFSRGVADVSDEGLVWTSGLVSIPGEPAELIGSYVNLTGLDAPRLSAGLLRWSPEDEAFEVLVTWPEETVNEPTGTAFVEGGFAWFTDIAAGQPQDSAFRTVRVPADLGSLADPSTYRTTLSNNQLADAWGPAEVEGHIGSVFWNEHLGHYVRVFARAWGDDAFLGETWLAASDSPMGPWVWATQVVTHDEYTFYNPRHHPEFDEDGGRRIFFEGTYADTFSGVEVATARYDYNQVMYGLDLDRLALPVPVYGDGLWARAALPRGRADDGDGDGDGDDDGDGDGDGDDDGDGDGDNAVVNWVDPPGAPAFFALDRATAGASALHWTAPDCAPRELSRDGRGERAFWALDSAESSPRAVPLYPLPLPGRGTGYTLVRPPAAEPIAWVWPDPIGESPPVNEHGPGLAADAGPDQCLPAGPVTLRGRARGADFGPDSTFSWTWEGGEAEGAQLTVEPDGLRVLTLQVTGPSGAVARDVVVVETGGEQACGGCAGCGIVEPGGRAGVGLALLALVFAVRRRR